MRRPDARDAAFLAAMLFVVLTYWLATRSDCNTAHDMNRTLQGD